MWAINLVDMLSNKAHETHESWAIWWSQLSEGSTRSKIGTTTQINPKNWNTDSKGRTIDESHNITVIKAADLNRWNNAFYTISRAENNKRNNSDSKACRCRWPSCSKCFLCLSFQYSPLEGELVCLLFMAWKSSNPKMKVTASSNFC